MSGLLGAGVLVTILADGVVGARLILLSLRTRQLPELAIGSSLFLLGGLGYPLAIAARNGLGGPENATTLLGAALALQNLGAMWMAVATWRTFRPDDALGRAGCLAVAALLLAGWGGQTLAGGFVLRPGEGVFYWLGFAGRVLPFAWSAAESWRYHGLLRRRLALGLADPVVTDRFRLWAISAAGVTAGFAVFAVATLARVEVASSAWVLLPTSIVGWISGVSFWLAFLPPQRYLRRFAPAPAPAT